MSKEIKLRTFSKPPMFPKAFKKLQSKPLFFTLSLAAYSLVPSVGIISFENFWKNFEHRMHPPKHFSRISKSSFPHIDIAASVFTKNS
jgi:hypothetical protein